jgi:predicted metalloprotease
VDENAFTHGTSQQRVRWFMKGFRSGQVRDGDTLSIPYHRL